MKDSRGYLRDLLTELEDIAAFTSDGREAFVANRMAQKAVMRSYEIIGEIVKRIPQEIREAHPQIDWRTLAAFRDYLIHRYDTVNLERVWIAVADLPNLKAAVETLLRTLDAADQDQL
jgi:uncharacterized protein with HEPN domain